MGEVSMIRCLVLLILFLTATGCGEDSLGPPQAMHHVVVGSVPTAWATPGMGAGVTVWSLTDITSAGVQCAGNKVGVSGGGVRPDGTFSVVVNAMTALPSACIRVTIGRLNASLGAKTIPEALFKPVSLPPDTSRVAF
jgi:hypothetical protein